MKIISSILMSAIALWAVPSSAHITLDVKSAPSNSYYRGALKVGHGCNGSATTQIRVTVPEGVNQFRPMPKAGWKIKIEKSPLSPPVDNHGKLQTERVSQVTWLGGSLSDDFYDEFVVSMKLPDVEGALYFKVLQTCEKGEVNWAQIPEEGKSLHDYATPAAELMLQAPDAQMHH